MRAGWLGSRGLPALTQRKFALFFGSLQCRPPVGGMCLEMERRVRVERFWSMRLGFLDRTDVDGRELSNFMEGDVVEGFDVTIRST